MKLFFTLLCVFALTFPALFAQQIISFPEGQRKEINVVNGKAFLRLGFLNETEQTLKLDWETIRNTMPEKDCDYQTCDNGFCHPLVPPVGQINTMMEIPPKSEGGEGFFTMEVKQCDCAGKPTGTAVYQIYKGGTKEPVAQIEFVFKCYPAGRINVANTSFRIYPNPVSDNLQIHLPDGVQSLQSVAITDMTGKTVDTPALRESLVSFTEPSFMAGNANTFQVKVNDLPAGIYLIRLTDASGKIHNQKFIKE
jgi:hypothetical protein